MKNRNWSITRAATRALMGVLMLSASMLGVTGPASAEEGGQVGVQSWHPATVGGGSSGGQVALRDCYHPVVQAPSTSCTLVKYVPTGISVHVVCQRSGQNINGNAVWDYVVYPGGEGYMTDYYLITGYNGFIPGVDYCS